MPLLAAKEDDTNDFTDADVRGTSVCVGGGYTKVFVQENIAIRK